MKNMLLSQNRELKKCGIAIKNACVYAWANVYSLENMLYVNSKIRGAHRYLTNLVHNDWARVADLPVPNIRSRTLNTWNGIHSRCSRVLYFLFTKGFCPHRKDRCKYLAFVSACILINE